MFVGVDIESISRFENKSLDKDSHFLNRIYTQKELDYCFKSKHPAKHLAARFCAKEAVYKALNQMLDSGTIEFSNIEILNNEKGAPFVVLYQTKLDVDISISLSHDKDKAIAFVIATIR